VLNAKTFVLFPGLDDTDILPAVRESAFELDSDELRADAYFISRLVFLRSAGVDVRRGVSECAWLRPFTPEAIRRILDGLGLLSRFPHSAPALQEVQELSAYRVGSRNSSRRGSSDLI
jgi:hypothetical protein